MFNVYKAFNTESGKSYIGITSRDVNVRWSEHLSRARCEQRQSRLYDAIRKYGADKFEVTVIDSSDNEDEIRSLETQYIEKFDTYENGYNCNLGGCGHLVIPDDLRKKIGEAQIGKIISEETRLKMSLAKRGDSRCAEHFGDYTKKGRNNPKSSFFLIRKDGEDTVIVGRGLRAFCRENDLCVAHLYCRGRTKGFNLLGTFNDYPTREYTQASGSAIHPSG